jgi:hypothetical protein
MRAVDFVRGRVVMVSSALLGRKERARLARIRGPIGQISVDVEETVLLREFACREDPSALGGNILVEK